MGTRDFFPGGKAAGVVDLTTHLHLVPRSRMCGAIAPFPQYASMAWCSVKRKYRGNFYIPLSVVRHSSQNKMVHADVA